MAISDPLGDMLTRIRNAQMPPQVECFDAGLQAARRVLDVLKSEGYIRGYMTEKPHMDNGVRSTTSS